MGEAECHRACGHVSALLVSPNAATAQTAWRIMYDVANKRLVWDQMDASFWSIIGLVSIPDNSGRRLSSSV